MKELKERIETLFNDVQNSIVKLRIEEKLNEQKELESKSTEAQFWHDPERAKRTMQKIAELSTSVEPWLGLQNNIKEMIELADMGDASLTSDLQKQLQTAEKTYNKLKRDLRYNEPFDDHGLIMTIYAGAGGTDAQDWAQMLERMYLRWFEQQKIKPVIIDRSVGEEAGIKSVTIEADGRFLYGKLKGEHGVHRLVRLSPFNSDNLRQTSFAKVDILPKIDQPSELVLDEKEIKMDVYRAGGHGGQSVNTTDSAVRLTHIPTGITVAIQNERSQIQNKETAMTILRSRLAQLQIEQHKSTLAELKGPNTSAEWGNQIRNYVLHPYKQVKDSRTGYETSDPQSVLDGRLDDIIEAYATRNLS